jgi:hypothetical protein
MERPQNKNLSKTGGPGRPKGQRNYATIYRDALQRIAEANDKTPEEIETMMEEVGLKQALKGNHAFWKDVRDRIHGLPKGSNATVNVNVTVEPNERIKKLAEKLNK